MTRSVTDDVDPRDYVQTPNQTFQDPYTDLRNLDICDGAEISVAGVTQEVGREVENDREYSNATVYDLRSDGHLNDHLILDHCEESVLIRRRSYDRVDDVREFKDYLVDEVSVMSRAGDDVDTDDEFIAGKTCDES